MDAAEDGWGPCIDFEKVDWDKKLVYCKRHEKWCSIDTCGHDKCKNYIEKSEPPYHWSDSWC